jgi:hypothetical protein
VNSRGTPALPGEPPNSHAIIRADVQRPGTDQRLKVLHEAKLLQTSSDIGASQIAVRCTRQSPFWVCAVGDKADTSCQPSDDEFSDRQQAARSYRDERHTFLLFLHLGHLSRRNNWPPLAQRTGDHLVRSEPSYSQSSENLVQVLSHLANRLHYQNIRFELDFRQLNGVRRRRSSRTKTIRMFEQSNSHLSVVSFRKHGVGARSLLITSAPCAAISITLTNGENPCVISRFG